MFVRPSGLRRGESSALRSGGVKSMKDSPVSCSCSLTRLPQAQIIDDSLLKTRHTMPLLHEEGGGKRKAERGDGKRATRPESACRIREGV